MIIDSNHQQSLSMQKTMMSIKDKDTLGWVLVQAAEIESATSLLKKRLTTLTKTISSKMCNETLDKEQLLTPKDVQGLLQLNRHLAKLEDFLVAQESSLSAILANKEADPNDPMADYEIEAELHYTLREDDPEWSDDSDNFLTQRTESLKGSATCVMSDDFRENRPGMEEVNTEPHCWLFHDLYDHRYGLTKPDVPLLDCLRLGKVWVDVVIRQQYWLNLETGEWDKDHPTSETSA